MKPPFSHETIIDYLEGSLPEPDRLAFEEALQQNESLRAEVESLRLVREQLSKQSDYPAPGLPSGVIRQKARQKPSSTLFTTLKYAAAVLIFIIAAGSVGNLNFSYDDNGFSLSMGLVPPTQQIIVPNDDRTLRVVEDYLEQQSVLVAELLDRERQQQHRQLESLFTEYSNMIENRRLIDLQLIQYEIESIQEHQAYRQNQTDYVLLNLIEALSFNTQ